MGNDLIGPCPKCGCYGTIVAIGSCCSVKARMEADEAFKKLPKVEQWKVSRSQQKEKCNSLDI